MTSTTTDRRQQRADAELDIQTDQKNARACDEKRAAHKLHQRLRDELVQFVGIVVQARNQVAGFVLIEKRHRQFLQLHEQSVAQIVENSSAGAAHGDDLYVARHAARDVDQKHHQRRDEQAVHVPASHVGVDGAHDEDGRDERRERTPHDGSYGGCDGRLLLRKQRKKLRTGLAQRPLRPRGRARNGPVAVLSVYFVVARASLRVVELDIFRRCLHQLPVRADGQDLALHQENDLVVIHHGGDLLRHRNQRDAGIIRGARCREWCARWWYRRAP